MTVTVNMITYMTLSKCYTSVLLNYSFLLLYSIQLNTWQCVSPEAGFDLAAAVDIALVLHGQREIPQVIQANAGVIGRHQDLQKRNCSVKTQY